MKFIKVLLFSCVLLLFAAPAYSLSIVPGDTNIFGNENNMASIRAVIEGIIGPLDPEFPLYKSNVEGGEEAAPLASSYQTTYSNTRSDPSNALIEYIGGPYVDTTKPAWLLVKDGNQSPAWYLFDLVALSWDGMDDLDLTGFWPGRGAISNVSLYGTSTPVPEPATMLLLGTGLIGLATFGRRKLFKKA